MSECVPVFAIVSQQHNNLSFHEYLSCRIKWQNVKSIFPDEHCAGFYFLYWFVTELSFIQLHITNQPAKTKVCISQIMRRPTRFCEQQLYEFVSIKHAGIGGTSDPWQTNTCFPQFNIFSRSFNWPLCWLKRCCDDLHHKKLFQQMWSETTWRPVRHLLSLAKSD